MTHPLSTVDDMDLGSAVDAVNSAIDLIVETPIDDVDAAELRSQLARLKRADSRLDGQLARLTHAADASGAFIGTGARDTAEWLGKETGTSTRANRAASDLGEAMSKSDELADAVNSGRLSSSKASSAVGAAAGQPIDDGLLDEIADLPLSGVRPATEAWRARVHGDDEADHAMRQRARRYVRMTSAGEGMTRLEGLLEPEAAAIVRTSLDSIMSESAFDGTGRTRDQRRADALTQLAIAHSKGEVNGDRSNAKLLATVPFETVVERGTERGVTHVGPTVDADTIRRLACDAGIHRVITGPGSSILDFGRENRLVSENPLPRTGRSRPALPLARVHDACHMVRRPSCRRVGRPERAHERTTLCAPVSPPPRDGSSTRLEDHRRRPRVRDPPTRRHHRGEPSARRWWRSR